MVGWSSAQEERENVCANKVCRWRRQGSQPSLEVTVWQQKISRNSPTHKPTLDKVRKALP